MAKQSSKKSKAKKEAHAKTPKKRSRKVAPAISRSALPTNMNYVVKQIPKHSLKFGSTYNTNFIRDLVLSIGDEGIQLFKDTIFGPYLNIPKCNYQGQITKCLLLLEVEQNNPAGELHIRHAKGNILNFSIKELAIITGLKCIGNSKDFTYPDSKRSRLVQRYFPGPNYNVNKQRLVDRFIMGGWDNIDDALQMAIMYFIHTFVLPQLGTAAIPIEEFLIVEDDSYQQFPWGQRAFTRLMNSLRARLAMRYDNDIAVKERNVIPRICNWKVMAEKPKFEMFMKSIFTENNCANIQPTVEEITSLDLRHISHVSPTEPAPSNVNPEVGRSIRVSSTGSTPPPKRRKVVHPHKTNVPKATQPDEQPNQPFQTPDLPTSEAGNVSGVLDNSDIRKVDQQIGYLEELIKQNHSELMKIVDAKDNKSEKVTKINVANSDDTSFKEQVMENATEVIHTTHHSHVLIEEVVLNKEADNAIDVAPQSDTKVLSGDEHGVDTLQQNLVKHALNLFLVDTSESAHNHDTKTSAPRNRMPSRIVRSSYLTSFGSSDKGKTKVDDDVRQLHPFEGCGILYQMSSGLMDEFSQWIEKGLLKSHANKKPFEDKYRVKSALFGVDHIDFVVTFPLDKNWFYTISQPKKCWTDEHIDVIFYYLRKKSKQRSMDQYRYTTVNYLFKSHINNAHTRYYNSLADDIISTQEHIARGDAVSIHERSIINIINGFSIPTALPWHLVDEVYIPVNCDEEFHWGLAVVVLRKRLIRVYDSNSGPRKKVYSGDIKKLSQILPTYLHDSGFFEKTERTDWAALDTYKDKKTGELLGPQHSFDVEFAQDIMQQESDSLDCEMFVAAFAEFLSDEINMSYDSFGSDYLRKRYATLLWKYGLDKAKAGYVSDNDDPPRLKSVLNSTAENELVNVG
ncbi:hypothetical protein KY285_028814 [Solanum tuberosum]|nr:hypothetical protein KY285_028814 [Solanum tuberosum]